MAQHIKKPLLTINIGTLIGQNVAERLSQLFRQADSWNAILLLDEADVLLEERSREDYSRNNIVSSKKIAPRKVDTFLIISANLFRPKCSSA